MKNKVEARSRVIIDRLLEANEWNLQDENEVQFEVSGNSGQIDYILILRKSSKKSLIKIFF